MFNTGWNIIPVATMPRQQLLNEVELDIVREPNSINIIPFTGLEVCMGNLCPRSSIPLMAAGRGWCK